MHTHTHTIGMMQQNFHTMLQTSHTVLIIIILLGDLLL